MQSPRLELTPQLGVEAELDAEDVAEVVPEERHLPEVEVESFPPDPHVGVAAEQAPAGHAPPAQEDRLDRMLGLLERLIQRGAGLQAGVAVQAPGYQQQITVIPESVGQPPHVPVIPELVGQPLQVPVVPAPVAQPPQVPAPVIGAPIALKVVLADDDQVSYERFQKMKPPQFQGAKNRGCS